MGEGESGSVGRRNQPLRKLQGTSLAVPSPVGYVFTALPTPVAQTCSLLYRRVALCQTQANHGAWDGSDILPIKNRRYGRLKICATVNRYPVGRERVRVRGILFEIGLVPGICFCT